MKKKFILAIMISLFSVFVFCHIIASAETYTCEDLTYEIINDEISIMACNSSATNVVIPEEIEGMPITTIKDYAFSGCKSLTSVTIPNSVVTMGVKAFFGCYNLEEMVIPFTGSKRDGLNHNSALGYIFDFDGYHVNIDGQSTIIYEYKIPSSLKKITITDENVIDLESFFDCDKIETILLGDGVTIIGESAFINCSSLKNITLSDSITTINKSAFNGCKKLENINIPKSVKEIKEYTFRNCTSLTSIKLPEDLTHIGDFAFKGCIRLKNITIPSNVQIIGVSAFEGCSSLEELTLPFIGSGRGNSGTVDSVLGYIFGYVTSYSDKTTDDTQQNYSSGSYAYYHIPASLKKVTVTDETFVGYGAFYGCTNISDIIIESAVKGIGSRAFAYHYNLLNVTIKSNSVKFADSMVFYDTDFATLYGYEGSTVEEYASKNGIDFEPIKQVPNYEISGYLKAINNTIVVSVELSDTVTDECLHIALYSEKGQLVDYIIVPSYKPFNEMNVVFKDTSNSTYAKVFLWNGFTSMQPLAEAKKIDIVR